MVCFLELTVYGTSLIVQVLCGCSEFLPFNHFFLYNLDYCQVLSALNAPAALTCEYGRYHEEQRQSSKYRSIWLNVMILPSVTMQILPFPPWLLHTPRDVFLLFKLTLNQTKQDTVCWRQSNLVCSVYPLRGRQRTPDYWKGWGRGADEQESNDGCAHMPI